MSFWPDDLKDWVDVITKASVVLAGAWALYQYHKSSCLKAAETLLKVEEEFRYIFPVYEEIEDEASYQRLVSPVLQAEKENRLDESGLQKLTQLDRCFRFLYLCSVLNEVLRVDRPLGIKTGTLSRAYYYYIGVLLPEEILKRPGLQDYTELYYPRLTEWVENHEPELREFRRSTKRRRADNSSKAAASSG